MGTPRCTEEIATDRFTQAVLAWFDRHGRRDLPWQFDVTPYRVWISEIMLQQTQVATAIPYFERFLSRFPSLEALAAAPLSEVLQLWAGLGYYSRARNLHRCAVSLRERGVDRLPNDLHELMNLPGIGRSTAGAILSIGFDEPAPILDGNVKRVLARYHAVEGWPGNSAVQRKLWALAEQHTPQRQVAAYTQAIMDLGATVCTARRPACEVCPVRDDCRARKEDVVAVLPTRRSAKPLPSREAYWAICLSAEGAVYLEPREPMGLWGGLWAFPSFDSARSLAGWALARGAQGDVLEPWKPRRHTFSHFQLNYTPVLVRVPARSAVTEAVGGWFDPSAPELPALPAPVAALLQELIKYSEGFGL